MKSRRSAQNIKQSSKNIKKRSLDDIIFFIENYVRIKTPHGEEGIMLSEAQKKLLNYLISYEGYESTKRRRRIPKSRRQLR